VQCGVRKRKRRDDGNLALRELGDERVLLGDRRVRPAAGTVELRNHGFRVLDADEVHAILVAAERLQPPVTENADGRQRIEHPVGRERGVRVR
jgi:hypothetical protein